jgi:hypothetical protein
VGIGHRVESYGSDVGERTQQLIDSGLVSMLFRDHTLKKA